MADVSRPPPPKRPTIIRPHEAHSTEKGNDTDSVNMRPAVSHGSGRPPPKPPNRPSSFRGTQQEETEAVQLRKSSNKPVRPSSVGSKNDSTSKRKLEITIVSARPMSEVGFRNMATNSTPQTKSEANNEHTKNLMDMKMAAPTNLVPDKSSLPPRPNKPDSSPHQRPPPPVPSRKDVPQSHDNKTPPQPSVSPMAMPRPRMNKSSPESQSSVPCTESTPPLKPRKHMTLPIRPLPPSPPSDDEELKIAKESPAKPQRTYEWSIDSETGNKSQSSIAEKPRRPTIIRPVKAKSIEEQKENHSSPIENSVSSLPKQSLPPVPDRKFEKLIINNENSEVECNSNIQNDVTSSNEKNINIPNSKQDTETVEKKKPPIAAKPKPSILPKPKLLHQSNVDVEDQTLINNKIESESESRKVRKPTIIRANVSKQDSGDTSVSSEKMPKTVEDIPDYASIQKPTTEKTRPKTIISSSFSPTKPPPPIPAKRFTPPSKSKDDLEIQSDNMDVQNRPKPVARTRPMSMMVTSTTKIETPAKPPPPSKGLPTKPSPPKPSPPSIVNQMKNSPNLESPVKPRLPNVLRKDSLTNTEKSEKDTESPKEEKVPPSRPLSVPRSKITSDHNGDESSEDDQEESIKAKPGRPRMGPPRPSQRPFKSPIQDQSIRSLQNTSTAKEGAPPDLPSRPAPGHPLYHYMLKVPHGQAIHDFDGTNPGDLSFKVNDIVILHKRIDDAWLHGQVGDVDGIFPQSFIHILRPFSDEIQMSPQSPVPVNDNVSDSDSSPCVSVKEKTDWIGTGPRCVARFDFEGVGVTDLSFEEGDYIKLLERVDSEWMKGKLYDKVGIFPMTFVEIIEELPDPTRDEVIEELPNLSCDAMNELVMSEQNVDKTETNVSESEIFQNETIPSVCSMCQAISDFHGESQGDLCFNEGDVIEIIGEIDENWLKGRLNNKQGIFPASFVIRIESHTDENLGITSQHDQDDFGEAVYDFDGENDNELSFKTGDRIKLGTIVDGAEDWQWGEIDGKCGIFPKSFVQHIN